MKPDGQIEIWMNRGICPVGHQTFCIIIIYKNFSVQGKKERNIKGTKF